MYKLMDDYPQMWNFMRSMMGNHGMMHGGMMGNRENNNQ